MHKINTKADKTHPYGVPVLMLAMGDSSDSVQTYCGLFVRKPSTNNCNLAGTL